LFFFNQSTELFGNQGTLLPSHLFKHLLDYLNSKYQLFTHTGRIFISQFNSACRQKEKINAFETRFEQFLNILSDTP